jgi:hypothetical protein
MGFEPLFIFWLGFIYLSFNSFFKKIRPFEGSLILNNVARYMGVKPWESYLFFYYWNISIWIV